MNSKQINGLAVIDIADGTKLGSLEGAFLDPAGKRIVGFGVVPSDGGDGAGGAAFVAADAVHALGPDALTVDDAAKLSAGPTGAAGAGLVDLGALNKHKVVTEGGAFVGQVASVEFDERSFRLTQVEVSPGRFKTNTAVPIEHVVSIGGDMVVVVNAAAADDSAAPTAEPTTSRFIVGDREPREPAATQATP